MRIVLLTSHSIAEYDDLRMLNDLGYDVFSIGAYTDPSKPGDDKRPALPGVPAHPELERFVHESREGKPDPGPLIDWAKAEIHAAILDWADVIICHHFPEWWIARQWPRIRHKRVIWRTCGQSNPELEKRMSLCRADGLQIVRYSPAEERFFAAVDAWAGADAVIRFGKYPGDFGEWNGDIETVTNVTQNLKARGDFTGYGFWKAATDTLPTLPIGPGSKEIGGTGEVGYQMMLSLLASCRAYLYTGTQPASYTLGLMEAMFAGIPTVSIGPGWMWAPALFEGHEITRVWHEEPTAAREALASLLRDWDLARSIGAEQRQRAIDLFGIDTIGRQWRAFLGAPA
jgi:hypothetical protein